MEFSDRRENTFERVEFTKEDLCAIPSAEEIPIEQISFTGKYTETEIRKMKENVSNCEYEVNNLKSKVSHWQRCYDLSHSSGDLSRLNDAKSRLSDATYRLSSAKSKLNNAT